MDYEDLAETVAFFPHGPHTEKAAFGRELLKAAADKEAADREAIGLVSTWQIMGTLSSLLSALGGEYG